MAKKAKTAPTAEKTAEAQQKKAEAVIRGNDRGLDVTEQTLEARGIDPKDKTIDAGKAGSAASRPPLTDEMKARDAQIEEREEYLRSQGLDPDTERNSPGGGGLKKVELADTKSKQYRGMVTVTGVHGQTHEKISARIDLPENSGEEFVRYAFFVHHPAADRDPSTITIDAENKDDPNLRSRWE